MTCILAECRNGMTGYQTTLSKTWASRLKRDANWVHIKVDSNGNTTTTTNEGIREKCG